MAGSHLKILLWKNWLLWKRNCCCSVMEIILPVLMCCFFFLFRSSLDTTAIDEKSYLEMKIPEVGKRE
jgi:ATP-binding cassette subfamily A (ABC1) protein 3